MLDKFLNQGGRLSWPAAETGQLARRLAVEWALNPPITHDPLPQTWLHPTALLALDELAEKTGGQLLADLAEYYQAEGLARRVEGWPAGQEAWPPPLLTDRLALLRVEQAATGWAWRDLLDDNGPACRDLDDTQCSCRLRGRLDSLRNAARRDQLTADPLSEDFRADQNVVYTVIAADLSLESSRELLGQVLERLAVAYGPDQQAGSPPFLRYILLLFMPATDRVVAEWQARLDAPAGPGGPVVQAYRYLEELANGLGQSLRQAGQSPAEIGLETFLIDDVRADNSRLSETNRLEIAALVLRELIFSPLAISLDTVEPVIAEVYEVDPSLVQTARLPGAPAPVPAPALVRQPGRERPQLKIRLVGAAELKLALVEPLNWLVEQTLGWHCGLWRNPSGGIEEERLLSQTGRQVAYELIQFYEAEVARLGRLDFSLPNLADLLRFDPPGEPLWQTEPGEKSLALVGGQTVLFNWRQMAEQIKNHARNLALNLDASINRAATIPTPWQSRAELVANLSRQQNELLLPHLKRHLGGVQGSLYRALVLFGEAGQRVKFSAAQLETLLEKAGPTDPRLETLRLEEMARRAVSDLQYRQERTPHLGPSLASGAMSGTLAGILSENLLALTGTVWPLLVGGGWLCAGWLGYLAARDKVLKERDSWLGRLAVVYRESLRRAVLYYFQPPVQRLNHTFNRPGGLIERLKALDGAAQECQRLAATAATFSPQPALRSLALAQAETGVRKDDPMHGQGLPLSLEVWPGDLCQQAFDQLRLSNLLTDRVMADRLAAFALDHLDGPGVSPNEPALVAALGAEYREWLFDYARRSDQAGRLMQLVSTGLEEYLNKHGPAWQTKPLLRLRELAALSGRNLVAPADHYTFFFTRQPEGAYPAGSHVLPGGLRRSLVCLNVALINENLLTRLAALAGV